MHYHIKTNKGIKKYFTANCVVFLVLTHYLIFIPGLKCSFALLNLFLEE